MSGNDGDTRMKNEPMIMLASESSFGARNKPKEKHLKFYSASCINCLFAPGFLFWLLRFPNRHILYD